MKGKKATIIVLAMLLSLSIPAAFSSSDTFTVDYEFSATVINGQWVVEDTTLQEIAGEPLIPYYPAAILLPPDADVKDVKVKASAPVVQTGFDIPWGQPPCTFSDEPVKVGKNEEIYGSDNDYPSTLFDIVSIESFRGFQILNVILYPMQYKPKSGTVKFYETMTVEVKFGKGLKNKLYRGLHGDKQAVSSMVDNPEMASTYEDGPDPLQTEEYIIITNDTMQSTFQTLANWKAGFVTGTGVYTVSWITANYTGVDDAEKVRNFIIDMYTNYGTLYVLLGGDIAAVPYRGFYVYAGGYVDYDMLADMYFAHLDGTFNDDGDSYWAEPGEVDWYAEVAVGRAPCETVSEAQNFVNKVIAYEQAEKPDMGQHKRALLHQSRARSGNSPDSRCLAWNCAAWLPADYYRDYLFEEDGTVTKAAWIEHWGYDPIVVAHMGHGSSTSYYLNYEIGGTVVWYCSDVSSLTNTFFPWSTSVACHTGEIEVNDCLAECYVMDPDNGAIVVIYNDNYGWFSSLNACAYSGEFCEMEFRACWSDGYEKFGDMLNQARSYLASSAQGNSTYRWCFYERNIVGDPESPSLTTRGGDSVTITNPANGSEVYGTVDITVDYTGCIDTVEFYIDGVLVYTDTAAPFEYSWDTTTHAEDTDAVILVKGYCSGVFTDDDTVTVTVNNYYVVITNPSEGETVSDTVLITTDTRGVDTVEFYIDGVLVYTDTAAPFEYSWDTTAYPDGPYTILVKGYAAGVFKDDDTVNVTVYNEIIPYVTITYPLNGQTISGVVTVTTDTAGCDEVRFYVNNELKYTDYTAPFTWDWDTTTYKNKGGYKLKAEGYSSGVFQDSDQIRVKISNPSIILLSLLVLFLPAGIIYRRR